VRCTSGVHPGAQVAPSSSTYPPHAESQEPAEGVMMSTDSVEASIISVRVSVECSGAKKGAMGTIPETVVGA
jgi:hypothetical protein